MISVTNVWYIIMSVGNKVQHEVRFVRFTNTAQISFEINGTLFDDFIVSHEHLSRSGRQSAGEVEANVEEAVCGAVDH